MGQSQSNGWTGMSEEQHQETAEQEKISVKREVDPRSPTQGFQRTPIRFFWKQYGTPHQRLRSDMEDPRSPNADFQRTPIRVNQEEGENQRDTIVQKLFEEESKTSEVRPLSVRN